MKNHFASPVLLGPQRSRTTPSCIRSGALEGKFCPATPTSARNLDPTRAPHVKEIVRTAPFSAAHRIELASNRVGSAI